MDLNTNTNTIGGPSLPSGQEGREASLDDSTGQNMDKGH